MPACDPARERAPEGDPVTAVSLFAGIGGFDLALARCGVRVVAAVEIDRFCRGVLSHRLPGIRLFTDVQEVTADDLIGAGFDPRRGILTAGWPCQDLSMAGRRQGLDGARSGLFFDVVRLARELRPRWLVLENVPGLLSSHAGRDMGTVVGALEDLGYGLAWRVLDAQFFGVPQRRRRVLFVAGHRDGTGPVQVLLEPESSGGDSPPGGAPRPDAARTVARCPGQCRRPGAAAVYCTTTCRRLTASRAIDTKNDPTRGRGGNVVVSALTSSMAGAGGGVDDNTAQAGHLVAATVTAREGKGPDSDATTTLITHTLPANSASEDGTGRGTPVVALYVDGKSGQTSDVAPTLRANPGGTGGPRITTDTTVRRLTPRECERLQGFPDDWTRHRLHKGRLVEQSDTARYRQLGNAIAVPVAEWVISRLIEVARASSRRDGKD